LSEIMEKGEICIQMVESPMNTSSEIPSFHNEILKNVQKDVPWTKKEHLIAPWFLKCDGKIAKYDMSGLHIWRALFSFSHTVLGDWDTWYHLNYLTVICFLTMGIVLLTGSYKSINNTSDLTARAQLLITFVLAGYITIVINRWDRVRNTTLGQLWGAIENLCQVNFFVLFKYGNGKQEMELSDRTIRYARLSMKLTFMAVQADDNLPALVEMNLLTEKEREWLAAATIGTRPLIVVSWMQELFDSIKAAGYRVSASQDFTVLTNVTQMRGGIGATLGVIGSQLPYSYVHVIYWIVQIMLVSLAIETGVALAVDTYFEANGANSYSPADDKHTWPYNPNTWYANNFLSITAGNMVFALFTDGLLKITEKLNNPLSTADTSFSDSVFDIFLLNNCLALRAGSLSYDLIQDHPLLPVLAQPLPRKTRNTKEKHIQNKKRLQRQLMTLKS